MESQKAWRERRRIWRKLHLAVDSKTHEIICADLSLNNVTDSEAFPVLSGRLTEKSGQHRQTALTTPGSVTMNCAAKNQRAYPAPKRRGLLASEYADRNRAVANQRLTGSNARWKWTTDYNRRSIAETAMYRVKQLFGGSLTLRDYDGQVAEAMAWYER
ncbi:transposase [Klebsiella pneumoniae]